MKEQLDGKIGCLLVVAFLLLIIGINSFIGALWDGNHVDEYGDWITIENGLNESFLILGIGIVLYIIYKIKSSKSYLKGILTPLGGPTYIEKPYLFKIIFL